MRLCGIVLASGLSQRFGNDNKLLMPIDGIPVVRRTVAAYCHAGLNSVLVVVGHQAEAVRAALDGLAVETVFNPHFAEGQSRALVCGVASLHAKTEAAVIGVGDQPLLTSDVIRKLEALYRDSGAPLCVPRYAGRRGNPVLFDHSLFPELLLVEGDEGGKPVVLRHRQEIQWLDIDDRSVGTDVDTENEYRSLVESSAI